MQQSETAVPARPVVRLQPRRHRRVRAGHPWIYSNEIEMTPEMRAIAPGTLVRLVNAGGEALGAATFNPHSLVVARLIDADPEAGLDPAHIGARVARARALRERLIGAPFYRLVHAEADGLPGLIVDRFGDVLVVQANTAGMQRAEAAVIAALQETLAPSAVLLRNDSGVRALEGLDQHVRTALGAVAGPVAIEENGVRFFADLAGGQKTGWFYDQRDNRAFVARLAAGRRVLDVFSYTGGFGIAAAAAGAAAAVLVDRSEGALALAERAAAENGVAARCRFVRAAAFAEMERLAGAGERFGVVVADPPAFVKSRKDLGAGAKGYAKMTRLAAALVEPGGILFVASCSHQVDEDLFAEQVRHGLAAAGRSGRILRRAGAAPDHPVHPFLPESAYLKSQTLQLD